MRRIGQGRREIIDDSKPWGQPPRTRGVMRECLTWILFSLAVGGAVMGLVFLVAANARADESGADNATPDLNSVGGGSLFLRSSAGIRRAPSVSTEVDMRISALVARAVIKQRFTNPTDEWVEGIYVFPLPEDAAVDHMRMRIGERVIEGQIRERGAAKRVYEQAKVEGKRATLIEQERPNLFTNSVANIGPRETIEVELEYQQVVPYRDGEFSLRVPLAITPRYIPGDSWEVARHEPGSGWARDTDQVPDASRITPPVFEGRGKINPVSVHIELDTGYAVERLDSPTHAIYTTTHGLGQFTVVFAQGPVAADRDFELIWTPTPGAQPRASLFTEQVGDGYYHLLMVLPPSDGVDGAQPLPREAVYIIDVSGSMAGTSITQAKAALRMALERLRPHDRFNIVAFNNQAMALFDRARFATPDTIAMAQTFVDRLEANGGTEMAPALQAALSNVADPWAVRQVVFLTDGAVGNEAQLFTLIHQNLGQTRLFTVGIGGAPNTHFMRKAAQFGRGTYTYIGDVGEVQTKMGQLFRKLESPVLRDIAVSISGEGEHEQWPRRVPDLYLGEPLVITLRSQQLGGTLYVRGERERAEWTYATEVTAGRQGEGMGVLWARHKIAALMDRRQDGVAEEEVRDEVVAVALEHHLVSKYTSLVAVDVTPARYDGNALATRAVAVNLPEGMVYAKVFGRLPQTATVAPLHLALGLGFTGIALVLWGWQRARVA